MHKIQESKANFFLAATVDRLNSDKTNASDGGVYLNAALMCYYIARARSPIRRGILYLFGDKIHACMFLFIPESQKDLTECRERLLC